MFTCSFAKSLLRRLILACLYRKYEVTAISQLKTGNREELAWLCCSRISLKPQHAMFTLGSEQIKQTGYNHTEF